MLPDRLASFGWVVVLLALATPIVLLERTGVLSRRPFLHVLSLATGLIAVSLLVAAFLPRSRVRTLTTQLGVERVLRTHRALAIGAGTVVLAHLVRPGQFAFLKIGASPHVFEEHRFTIASAAIASAAIASAATGPHGGRP